jgi:hypothetical protein
VQHRRQFICKKWRLALARDARMFLIMRASAAHPQRRVLVKLKARRAA